MVMMRFNYTSLERGFESISLRCQYCGTEQTRSWLETEATDPITSDQAPKRNGDDQAAPPSGKLTESASADEARPSNDGAEQAQRGNVEQKTDDAALSDGTPNDPGPSTIVLTARQGDWHIYLGETDDPNRKARWGSMAPEYR
jgi:hypothetical protein